MRHRSAFTLIELLVVIAILAVLAVVVVLTLNPAGLLQEARDANRISDMATINNALGLSLADNSSESLGSPNTVYVSVPDPTATTTAGDQCQGLGLLSLPSGFSYHCAASSTYRKTDSTGWIPVNLSANTFGSSMAQLPQDPINATSSRLYYTYETDGSGRYEATTPFESSKYKLGGSNDQISGDGGTLASVYEKGSKLGMEPLDYGDPSLVGYWTFDEGTGSTTYDWSGNNATGSWQGTLGSQWTAGRIGPYAGSFNGSNDYIVISSLTGTPAITSGGGAVTIAGWAYLSDTNFRSMILYGNGFSFLYNGSCGGTLYAPYFGTGGCVGSVIPVGTWAFYALTYNGKGGTGILYEGIGGSISSLSGTYPLGTSSIPANPTVYIGNSYPNYYWFGSIDDVRIYNRALSAAEIQALYAGGK
jgi:prepilin-type N-terminal cleavage/methylation domain-containing protein